MPIERLEPRERQARVKRTRYFANRTQSGSRITTHVCEECGARAWMLKPGPEHHWTLRFAQGPILAGFHHANDFVRNSCTGSSFEQTTTHGFFIGPELIRHRLINDGHGRGTFAVGRSELTAPQKDGSHRGKVVRTHVECLESVPLLLRRRLATFHVVVDPKIPRIERQIVQNGDGLDTRHGGHAFEETVIELPHLFCRVTVILQVHFSRYPILDLKTQFDVLRVEQAAKAEGAGDQQDETSGDLSDDERAGKTGAPDPASLHAFFQSGGEVRPGSLPRRSEAEHNSGQQGNQGGESEYAGIQAHLGTNRQRRWREAQ